MAQPLPAPDLLAMMSDARARTLELVGGLDAGQLMGPRLAIVNPLLWEIGHLAWFHEHFILCRLDGATTMLANADALYDSAKVEHATRWDLPMPRLTATLDYLARVKDALAARLAGRTPSAEESYLYQLTTYHEDMHGEAFVYMRQTLGYPAPVFADATRPADADAGPWPGDAAVPGGRFVLGSRPDGAFVFDNEKWAHGVAVEPFAIARAPVTNGEFAAFVAAGGYRDPAFWSDDGWRWREAAAAEHPVYWQRQGENWSERRFDRLEPLKPHRPVAHVNWFEAEAWCHWAGRRLPTEAEWEAAALAEPGGDGQLGANKRRYPWGDAPPTAGGAGEGRQPRGANRANLDGAALGTVDVAAGAAGDSPWGCRQMLGNVWEWTASAFIPYPGFSPDAYAEYSAPWFGTRKVLRGGSWATRARLISGAYRNFFTPDRRDLPAGFRTCAV